MSECQYKKIFALVLANFIAFLDGSTASNLQNGLSFNIDIDKKLTQLFHG